MKIGNLLITGAVLATLFLLSKRAEIKELEERYLLPPEPEEEIPERPGIVFEPHPALTFFLPWEKIAELWPWKKPSGINFLPTG